MNEFSQSRKDLFFLSDGTTKKLDFYADLIKKWSPSHNLVSSGDLSCLWERHFSQALSLLPYMPSPSTHPSIVDLGSGSGILGITLAFCGYDLITLVESNKKKAVFLQVVSRETNTPICVKNIRIEEIKNLSFQIVISRALTSLGNLLQYCLFLLDSKGYGLFLKGEKIFSELEDALREFYFDYEIFPIEGRQKTHIIKVSNVIKK